MSKTSGTCAREKYIAGYSLVELLVALGIIALIAALAAPQVLRYLGQARSQAARTQLQNLQSAIELYYLDVGAYPASADGLSVLVKAPEGVAGWNGPYIKKAEGLTDPWGSAYVYKAPGDHGAYDVYSLGRDQREGGSGEDADITSW